MHQKTRSIHSALFWNEVNTLAVYLPFRWLLGQLDREVLVGPADQSHQAPLLHLWVRRLDLPEKDRGQNQCNAWLKRKRFPRFQVKWNFLGQQRWSFLNCVALWHRQFLKKSSDWHMEWNQHLRGSSSRLIRRRPLPWVLITERAGSPFLLSNRFLLESPVGREKTRRKLWKDGLVQISFPGSLLFLPFIVALENPWNGV